MVRSGPNPTIAVSKLVQRFGLAALFIALLAVTATASNHNITVMEDGFAHELKVYPAGIGQTDGVMTLVVNNEHTSKTINVVRFEAVRTSGATLEWNLDNTEAQGWARTVANQNDPQVATFKPTGAGNGIPPGGSESFTLGFAVTSNGNTAPRADTQIGVRVEGDYDTTSIPFNATPYNFKVVLDATSPGVFTSKTAGLVTGDADGNGHLDEMYVHFDDRINEETFVLNHWTFGDGAYIATKADFEVIQPGDQLMVGQPAFGTCPTKSQFGCSQIRFFLVERPELDTGVLPPVTYTPPAKASEKRLQDLAGNDANAVGSATVWDGAAPVLTGALAYSSDNTASDLEGIMLTFSEPVQGAGKAIAAGELKYTDVASGTTQVNATDPPRPDVKQLLHPPTGATGSTALLIMKTPLRAVDAPAGHPDTAVSDRIGCDGIVDISKNGPSGGGLPCTTEVPVLTPALLEAIGNIDSKEILLRFNVPVEAVGGGAVGESALSIEATTSGGPSGISNIKHARCTKEVVLTVDNRIKPDDVDAQPVKVKIQANQIQGCSRGHSATTSPIVSHRIAGQLVNVRDTIEPAIATALTVDQDGNGVIDGFSIEFSEPVKDVSFCAGSNPCPIGGRISIQDPTGRPLGQSYGPFRWETGTTENDRYGMITWPQNNPGRADALGTGFVPDLLIKAGLIQDMVPDAALYPANSMLPAASADIREQDGARPVIVFAATLDSEVRNKTASPAVCRLGLDVDCEEDPDGTIDGYTITFSERVRDSSFSTAEWAVSGRNVTGIGTANRADNGINDRTLVILFEEQFVPGPNNTKVLVPDTADTPQLTYKALPALGGLKDLRGNRLADVNTADVLERDGARPVIVSAKGFTGDTKLRVRFSEPVDDGRGGALVHTDFTYLNGNGANGAVGIVNSPQVVHEPGASIAVVSLNLPLTEGTLGDLSKDRIAAASLAGQDGGHIFETSKRSVGEKLSVLSTPKFLEEALDVTKPGKITDLGHLTGLLQSTLVGLNWTAPGDDAYTNGTVTAYRMKVSSTQFTSFNGTAGDELDAGINITYDPPNTRFEPPGREQRALLRGLMPATQYYIAVVGVDEEGNVGATSNIHQVTTLRDETPPEGQLNVRVINAVAGSDGKPQLSTKELKLSWDAAQDPESVVTYRYIVSRSPTFVLGEKNGTSTEDTTATVSVQEDGVWWVHVAAYSGVKGPTSKTSVLVLPPSIAPLEVAQYDAKFNSPDSEIGKVTVKRVKGGNQVSWMLPADPPGELTGLQVWRLNKGIYTLVGNVTGDFTTLKNGNFTDSSAGYNDKSRYHLASVFAGDQTAGAPEPTINAGAPVSNAKEGLPTWAWVLIVIGGVLIVAGAVLAFVMRARADAAPGSKPADHGWVDVDGGEGGALPTHEVDCPSCSTSFSVQGHLPMPITCPQCGVAGKLE